MARRADSVELWRRLLASHARGMRVTDVRRLARNLIRSDHATLRDLLVHVDAAMWSELRAAVSPAIHPYFEFALRRAGATSAVPDEVRHALDTARRAAILNDLRRRTVLRSSLAILAARGIDTILVKGAALSRTIYPEAHLRRMTDIDIWVPTAALDDAAGCLLENGYEVPESGLPEGRVSPAMTQRRLRAPKDGFIVELHGPVRSLECLSHERLRRCWQRTVPLRVQDVGTRMLGPEDALVHTCLHLAMINQFAKSQVGLLDVTLLIDKWGDDIDWIGLARDARDQRIAVYLTMALTIAREVWGARVPEEFFTAVGPMQGVDEIKALALGQVWEPPSVLPSALERVLRQPTGRARLALVFQRAIVHPWRPSAGEARNPWRVLRQAIERLRSDVTVKVPAYIRAWARGDLARGELRRRGKMAEERGRIEALARHAEMQLHQAERRGTK